MPQKNLLIFGLGNPGQQYEKTFHNAGFQVIDQLLKETGSTELLKENRKTNCTEAKLKKDGQNLILAKPQSFMNLSGIPFQKILSFYKLEASQVLIIHDDADLPFGTLRFAYNSGSGGHNGVASIFQETGHQNFYRLKIGIGRPEKSTGLKGFVLEKIPDGKKAEWVKTLEKAAEGVLHFCQNGYEKTASLFNN